MKEHLLLVIVWAEQQILELQALIGSCRRLAGNESPAAEMPAPAAQAPRQASKPQPRRGKAGRKPARATEAPKRPPVRRIVADFKAAAERSAIRDAPSVPSTERLRQQILIALVDGALFFGALVKKIPAAAGLNPDQHTAAVRNRLQELKRMKLVDRTASTWALTTEGYERGAALVVEKRAAMAAARTAAAGGPA